MTTDIIDSLFFRLETFSISFVIVLLAGLGLAGLVYLFLLWWRNRNREERSLDYVLLQVAVPRDNEIKIDAAEQMFASIYSLKRVAYFLS